MRDFHTKEQKEFIEKVIQIDRISRTVKGGRRIRFRALVVIGNMKGKVGVGTAKAQEVVIAISKAVSIAKKNIIDVPLTNDTIPHEIKIKSGSAVIFLKPAKKGTSLVAGGSVRSVLELAGIKNVVGKILGSNNKINNVNATIEALKIFTNEKNTIAKKEEKKETIKKNDSASKNNNQK